jgi:hypothetical protein
VPVDQNTTEWFQIQKGATQACKISHGMFNLYSEHIIKTAEVGDMVVGMGNVT